MPAAVTLDATDELLERLSTLGIDPARLPAVGDDAPWKLTLTDGHLSLAPHRLTGDLSDATPIWVAFDAGRMGFRLARADHEAVVKAVRGKKKNIHHVIDGTAGLGRDAFLLAAAGMTVDMVEANPWVHALLADGLAGLQDSGEFGDVGARLTLHFGATQDFLAEHTADAVYLDPMFPLRDVSQKVGKDMQVFHQVVGEPLDEAGLMDAALQAARHKVVVKRPIRAPELDGRKPASQVRKKKMRFDVYPVG